MRSCGKKAPNHIAQEGSVARVPCPLHHAALCVRDVDVSLRFYRDGLGLDVLMDHRFEGDWPALFDAPSRHLRSVFLGDSGSADAGIVELVVFDDATRPPPGPVTRAAPPGSGFFLLSFFVDLDATLRTLHGLGFGEDARRVAQPGPIGPVSMATVQDPDGVLVELIHGSQPAA
jgi:catechol 2,3-dioxygenase-like lactoylglutathione lyase family enzyme